MDYGGIDQRIGDVTVAAHSNVQIGIFGLLGGEDAKRREIQRWLAPWFFSDDSYDRQDSQFALLKQHHEAYAKGTCAWFLDDVFRRWLGSDNNFMWLHGEVGSGKSVLSYSALSDLSRADRPDGVNRLLAFAIFAYNLEYSHRTDFIIRTILAFLATADPIPAPIANKYDSRHSMVPVDWNIELKQNISWLDHRTSIQDLEDNRCRSMVLVLDAIDEIPTVQARNSALRVLDLIQEISSRSRHFKVRVILFTRDDPEVREHCRGWQEVVMEKKHVSQDIQTAVYQRFILHDKMQKIADAEKLKLAKRIADKADGMFRLASLYVDELERCNLRRFTAERLEQELEGLPYGLYPTYDQMLRKIENGSIRKDLLIALRFILYSAGPVFIEDVVDVCATLPSSRPALLFSIGLRLDPYDLEQHLSGLILIRPPLPTDAVCEPFPRTHRIAFKHFSVNEYLLQMDGSKWQMEPRFFDQVQAQLGITRACFAYIAHAWRVRDSGHDLPFRLYAWKYWSRHAAAYLTFSSDTEHGPRLPEDPNPESHPHLIDDQGLTEPTAFAFRLANCFLAPQIYADEQRTETLKSSVKDIAKRISAILEADIIAIFNNVLCDPYYLSSPPDTTGTPLNSAMNPYDEEVLQRTPLTTRLVVVEPGLHSSPLQCWLLPECLENAPTYTALSYVWGTGYSEREVLLYGKPHVIPRNLYHALLRIRKPQSPLVIWIDTISINQADPSDRNYQVSQMQHIYGHAHDVVTWLGEPDIDTIDTWYVSVEIARWSQQIDSGQATMDQRALDEIRNATEPLFGHRIWQRVWLVQENALAKQLSLQWGSERIEWLDLVNVYRTIWTDHSVDGLGLPNTMLDSEETSAFYCFSALLRMRERSNPPRLPELLWITRHHECAFVGDKIYSLIGLLEGEEARQCAAIVDYTKTGETIFREVTDIIFGLYADLDAEGALKAFDVLSMCGDSRRQADEGPQRVVRLTSRSMPPTWVPDWSGGLNENPLEPGVFKPQQPPLYRAGLGYPEGLTSEPFLKPARSGTRYILLTQGIYLDTITSARPAGRSSSSHFDVSYSILLRNIPKDRLLRILLEDRDFSGRKARRLDADDDLERLWETSGRCKSLRAYSVFKTSNELFGMGRGNPQTGDIVVIFLGARVPFILRPSGEVSTRLQQGGKWPKSSFALVGECYVEGMMDGEAMKDLKMEDIQELTLI